MISSADLAGYQARARGKKIVPGKMTKKGVLISEPEERLAWQLTGAGILYKRNFPFHPTRKWTSDFLILPPPRKGALLIEVEGRGRHQSVAGFEVDCWKYAEALILGYLVLSVTPHQVKTGQALDWITQILAGR